VLHLWVIALFVAVALRDSLHGPLLDAHLSHRAGAAITLGALALVGVLTHVIIWIATRRLRARGTWRPVLVAEGAAATARWLAVAIHGAGVLALGWLDAIRDLTGDIVALDEFIALAPPLLLFAWCWWALWPMERMLRDAAVVRHLDEGATVYPTPARAAYTIVNLRQHVLVWLAPLLIILAWSESADRLLSLLAHRSASFAFLRDDDARSLAQAGADLLGAILVFVALGPLAMRYVWDTVPMPPGPLRDRLDAMCRRHRVRVSRILVWRTHGTMVNGAVLGLTPAFRYVLLTDALLDSLPDTQVEAVMAHEVAHVRHRHIVWLGVVIVTALAAVAAIGEQALGALGLGVTDELPEHLALAVALVTFALAMGVFGFVSRRFEWQADAFAAAHMSESLTTPDAVLAAPTVTSAGADAMAAALRSVARLNHVPEHRRSWRHGSIRTRLDRLASTIGLTPGRLPADRAARRLKILALLVAAALASLFALQFLAGD
jgi:STE24 endopeptidase